MKLHITIIAVLTILSINACSNSELKEKEQSKKEQSIKTAKIKTDEANQNKVQYVIQNNSIIGMKPLDLMIHHEGKIQRGKVREGNKIMEAYMIEQNGVEIGTVEPFKGDDNVIGNITINSSIVSTEKGIRVGSSYLGDLKREYENLSIKNAKKRGKIYAKSGHLAFLLDFESNNKDLKLEDIPVSATVLEIVIVAKKSNKKSS